MTTVLNRCVVRGVTARKVMPHDEFMERIKKTLYYGSGTAYKNMAVSSPLAEYASELFSEPHKGHSLNRLNKITAGSVRTNPCSLIMALIYLDRMQATDPNYVRRITPSELFIVSMMVSTKFYCGHDEQIDLAVWAKEGNMSEERIKELELEFLLAIEWNAYISNEQFFSKLAVVEKILAHREGIRRGWLTYTELLNFLPPFTLAKFLCNSITVMAVSYAASVITIAGAFFLVSQIPGNALSQVSTDTQIKTNTSTLNSDIDSTTEALSTATDTVEYCDIRYYNFCAFEKSNYDDLQKLHNESDEKKVSRQKNNEVGGPLINFNENYLMKEIRIGMDSGINWHRFKDNKSDYEEDDAEYNLCGNCTDTSHCTTFNWHSPNSWLQYPVIWFKYI